jgi:DNA-binding LacI/PurR family transcriptional regulator
MSNKKANIYDVANLAGVSHQTVSRVLNNHPSLKPATREKVEKAIAKLNYRPNQAARQLVTSESKMIGILTSGSELFGPSSILKAMEREARSAGYSSIAISVETQSKESWIDVIAQLRSLNIDGIITIALPREIVNKVEKAFTGTPLVVVDTEPAKGSDVVNIDNVSGGFMATQHLIDLGHKNIAHITGPALAYEGNLRRQGYEEAMKQNGLKPRIIDGDWSIETGFNVAGKLVDEKKLPTAFFCANDHLAVGVMKALFKKGFKIPEDISIVGFDDIPEAAYLLPSLTTVRQEFNLVGKIAIDRVLNQLTGDKSREITFLPLNLLERNSTQALTHGKRK